MNLLLPQFLHHRPNRMVLWIALLLWCWNGLTQSMFVDGLTYATIARNMALGDGSFWHPHYWNQYFYGHPPLFFWFESWLYRWFGDTFIIEKTVSFLFNLSIFFSIPTLWKWAKQPEEQAWIPLLFWSVSPLVVWSSMNHLLELPMTLLCIWAVGFWYRYQHKQDHIWGILSGLFLLMAVFIKGPVALFPMLWPWMQRTSKKMKITFLLAQLLPFFLAGIYILFDDEAQWYGQQYVHQQLFTSFQQGDSRWQMVTFWLQILIPWFFMAWILSDKKEFWKKTIQLESLLWIPLACSLPIIISAKQHDYYLLPFLPWAAIGFGQQCSTILTPRTAHRFWEYIIIFLLVIEVSIRWEKPGKDAEILTMMQQFSAKILNDCRIGYEGKLAEDWTLIAYGLRYHRWWNRGIKDCDWVIGLNDEKGSIRSGKYYLKKVPLPHE